MIVMPTQIVGNKYGNTGLPAHTRRDSRFRLSICRTWGSGTGRLCRCPKPEVQKP